MKKFILVVASVLLCGICFSQSVEEIMKKYDANKVYQTGHMKAKIEVTDKFGTTVQEFESWSKKGGDTLIAVTAGPDAGQKILRLENSVYLYYPDAEEVIRLQGSALKDSIMGSDFTYEDLTGDNSILDNYNGELLGSEKVGEYDCYHVMLTAKTKKQLYQKQELWIEKNSFAEVKSIVYSASGKAMSENLSWNLKPVGKYIVAMEGKMTNLLKKNSSTKMTITFVECDIDIPAKTFSRDNLSF